MDEKTRETLKVWGVDLTEEQTALLKLFKDELLEKNTRFNLFSRNDADYLWPRHILDALAGAPLLKKLLPAGGVIADAGAGFPGIPLAVALPGCQFDLWDSSLKRQMFLTWAASRLRLKNVHALHSRIGQSGTLEAGKYDAVVERAMGKLENILPQCLNMLKAGGVFLAWQSSGGTGPDGNHAPPADKDPEIRKILGACGGLAEKTASYRLPLEEKNRLILVFRKTAQGNTDAYP